MTAIIQKIKLISVIVNEDDLCSRLQRDWHQIDVRGSTNRFVEMCQEKIEAEYPNSKVDIKYTKEKIRSFFMYCPYELRIEFHNPQRARSTICDFYDVSGILDLVLNSKKWAVDKKGGAIK